MTEQKINTANSQMVGVRGDEIFVMLPKQIMTYDEALLHAAWLVALADGIGTHSFQAVLKAVVNT